MRRREDDGCGSEDGGRNRFRDRSPIQIRVRLVRTRRRCADVGKSPHVASEANGPSLADAHTREDLFRTLQRVARIEKGRDVAYRRRSVAIPDDALTIFIAGGRCRADAVRSRRHGADGR